MASDDRETRVDQGPRVTQKRDPSDIAERLLGVGLPRDHAAEARALATLERELTGRSAAPLTLGRYVLLRCLGAGAWGSVYAAYDPKLDRQVAIKLMHRDPEANDQEVDQAIQEATALARLAHPNVVAVYDVGEYGDEERERLELPRGASEGFFIVMELVNGITLREWLRVKQREWPDVLDALTDVARGLSAAHTHGVVHRDVKPANVLVGADGRVRVADFGLARATRGSAGIRDTTPTIEASRVAGTPSYMAPEQHRGDSLDGRADQFAFCVMGWEALLGERPFDGPTIDDLAAHKEHGPPAPPASTRVPGWLLAVMGRGLAASPTDRFASMDALLASISRGRHRGRRNGAFAIGTVLVAGLGAAALWPRADTAPEACVGQSARLAGVWDAATKKTVRDVLTRSDHAFGEASWRSVEPLLDDYAALWVETRTSVCQATFVQQTQGRELLEYRESCLQVRLARVQQVVALLSRSAAPAARHAVVMAETLPDPAACAHAIPAGGTGSLASRIALEQGLSQARAFSSAARWNEAIASATKVEEGARDDRWPVLAAESLLVQADAHNELGDPTRAEELLRTALGLATEANDIGVVTRVLTEMIQVVGRGLHRYSETAVLVELATAHLRRRGLDDELDAALAFELAALRSSQGHYADGLDQGRRALGLYRRFLPADDTRIAGCLNSIGLALYELDDLGPARDSLDAALDMYRTKLGKDHPEVAIPLHNLSLVDFREERYRSAHDRLVESLEILTASLGADHPRISHTLTTLGNTLFQLQRFEEASEHHVKAIAILRRQATLDVELLGAALFSQGQSLAAQGRPEAAMTLYDQTLSLFEGKLRHDDQRWAHVFLGRSSLHLDNGQPQRALDELAQVFAHIGDRDAHPMEVASALAGLGRAHAALNRPDLARAEFEESAALLTKLGANTYREEVESLLHALPPDL